MNRAWISSRTRLLVPAVLGVLSLIFLEMFSRGGLAEAVAWGIAYPHLAFANLVLIFGIMMLLASLMGRVFSAAVITFLIILLFSVVNHGKLVRLQQPLFPWDFWYYKQVLTLLPALSKPELVKSLFWPCSAAVFVVLCRLVGHENSLGFRGRIAMLLAALVILTSVVGYRTLSWNLPSLLATENEVWDQKRNYDRNGFLLAFAMNAQPILIDEPEKYCEETLRDLLEHMISDKYETAPGKRDEPINLILFVSESFYDLMHVTYEADEDPLQHFHELRSRFPSFRMISPTFGGNTSHVEFEMLTGLSNSFLPPSSVPYDHYVKRELPSIPGILRSTGYRTIAIHPYHDWFWNRNNVFPLMGFEEFVSLREFNGAKQRGWFVSDEALVDKIIERIEGIGESPFFVYALSMQNHGEYDDPNRYASEGVEVRADLPERLMPMLKTYVTGLRDADRELSRLLRYLENRPEPILTLFCGDHLPSFGPKYTLYRESGAVPSDPDAYHMEDFFNMASVPCVMWANREDLLDQQEVPEHLSPIYFPPLLLKKLGVEMPAYFRYLAEGMGSYPVVHRRFVGRRDGQLLDFTSVAGSDPFLKGFELAQYDILFGKQYLTGMTEDWSILSPWGHP